MGGTGESSFVILESDFSLPIFASCDYYPKAIKPEAGCNRRDETRKRREEMFDVTENFTGCCRFVTPLLYDSYVLVH